jgi:hypothetical protein
MHNHERRWIPFALLSGPALGLWALAAVHGYAWQTIWLPATVAGAAWPRHTTPAIGDCLRRLRRDGSRTFNKPA